MSAAGKRPAGAGAGSPARPARAAGVLLHPSSLPGRFSIGDFGPAATRFLDWAASAGFSLWQVLPLAPTGPGDSPYGGTSAFAGNPLFVSPEALVTDGWLAPEEAEEREDGEESEESKKESGPDASVSPSVRSPAEDRVDFASVAKRKTAILRTAWRRFRSAADGAAGAEFEAFRVSPAQRSWLDDWTLFSALRRARGGAAWTEWEPAIATREPGAVDWARRELAEEIAFEEFVQFLFFRQWGRVRAEASARGIAILGDLPIYVSHDSADVWAHRELFALDPRGRPEKVAGVPPDYFSETGQLWGYPVYRWDACAREGYAWWIERLRANLRLADAIRVDHFRGFAGYWEVAANEATAVHGRWAPGPGRELFDAATRALGPLPLVAEDLGTITEDVALLLAALGIPGMRVLQFAFSEEDSPHLPHRHVENAFVYTGTHDNDTTCGWEAALPDADRERLRAYAGTDLVRLAYESVAKAAIVPAQDLFALESVARMNTPGVASGNWSWRARAADFTQARAAKLRTLATLTGRMGGRR